MRQRFTFAVLGLIVLLAVVAAVTVLTALVVMLPTVAVITEGAAYVALAIIAWLLYVASSTLLGQLLLRFGLRAFPLSTIGRRQTGVIGLLGLLLGAVAILGVAGITMLVTFVSAPLDTRVNEQSTDGSFLNGLAILIAKGVVGGLSLFAKAVALYGAIFLAGIGIAVCAPLTFLLISHIKPGSWRGHPYVLFLRPFRGTSNGAAMGPIARGIPGGMRIVSLSPPFRQATSWDPVSLGLAGFRLTSPYSSVPVRLASHDDHWADDVRALARDAQATVIDVTDSSTSIQEEIKVLNSLDPRHPIVWLARHGAEVGDLQLFDPPPTGKHLHHEERGRRVLVRSAPRAATRGDRPLKSATLSIASSTSNRGPARSGRTFANAGSGPRCWERCSPSCSRRGYGSQQLTTSIPSATRTARSRKSKPRALDSRESRSFARSRTVRWGHGGPGVSARRHRLTRN